MAISILMPKVSFIVTEGTIINWLKEPGDEVVKGEPLFQMESEKATIEVEAPGSGILGENLAPVGITAPVTTIVGFILEPGEACPPLYLDAAPANAETTNTATLSTPSEPQTKDKSTRIKASPIAKRLAQENDIELDQITGTGPNGRITQDDVKNYIAERETAEAAPKAKVTPAARKYAKDQSLDLETIQGTSPGGRISLRDVEQVKAAPAIGIQDSELVAMTNIQRVAAERMALSFGTAPHFYLSVQVNMSQAVAMREALLPAIEARVGVRLSFTDILAAAVAESLARHPEMNASYEDGGARRFGSVNVGLAVDTPRGLTVAVVPQTNGLSLADLARRRSELIERARNNQLLPEEISQGTFTISNLGMFGIDLFNAIINPPQAAILAVGKIAKRPVVINDSLAIAPIMWMSLSVDHRVADGASGARFLQTLVGILENPYQLVV
ncbi:MAG: 2-oxo acid dehydrogenase subunit E2 [Anaerolineales bacterium]|nr:2-oxo acid dehydrogenase subunit E2 [Anaerolineales bacterium]